MRRVAGSRREHPDLLARAPGDGATEDPWAALLIDRVAQVAELADLVARGLVSAEEFERQRRRLFDS